jgi:opacity protein-like surface antigen
MRTTLLRALALTALCASPLLAQGYPQTREGFTAAFGVGFGSAGVTCDDCDSERQSAPSVLLRLGGAYRPNLILGGEINAWTKSEEEAGEEARVTIGTINFIAQWYPQTTSGFFLDAGIGLGSINTEVSVSGLPGTFNSRTTALGYQIGTGYDFRIARNVSLTPYATFFGTAGGKVENSDAKIDANVGQVGLAVTIH